MTSLVQVQIDETIVRDEINRQITERISAIEVDRVFWDASELQRQTSMSWNFIQKNFFFDPRFPKRKIGAKWYFPAQESREFLVAWLREQPPA